MNTIKITSWNVEHLARLVEPPLTSYEETRRDAIVAELEAINPDILCLVEGPRGEDSIDQFTSELLANRWRAVKAADGEYGTRGTQWIWFLVKEALYAQCSLLPVETWDAFTTKNWDVHYWGDFESTRHRHYRHPQVLVLDWNGFRVEFIGLHLKSKFVNQGASLWKAGGEKREEFIREALKARVKLTTEATNVREYIAAKFEQVEKPAIFIMGDLNDGPGKEFFEQKYLFFDLMSNIQGDIFQANQFMNHGLFDFPDHLRWTVKFKDFVAETEAEANLVRPILLDHILFTQGLCDDSLPWRIDSNAGLVEHEIHQLINASLSSKEQTSDHTPVSLTVTVKEE
ncbi:MAG: endonuclease/exonuclease/phosphatase family protein [Anaerolineae bacterium]|jgi:endonuclease/exonuclease/phosphatase family metal-dependent hydrolase|nr:endonuclease/exonuclease/phosphatase family protein [Anaerolineae bacterium]